MGMGRQESSRISFATCRGVIVPLAALIPWRDLQSRGLDEPGGLSAVVSKCVTEASDCVQGKYFAGVVKKLAAVM